jgi:uncharacterized zinc-type alcohol dehydrogenase-like protein
MEQFPIGDNEYKTAAWAVPAQGEKHVPMWIPRGNCGDEDVKFEILFSGICHTDIHIGHNDTHNTTYPLIAGHELVGRVTEVGSKVAKFAVGDMVGVGCIVDSCLDCKQCNKGHEQYCNGGMTMTYNNERKHGRVPGNQSL